MTAHILGGAIKLVMATCSDHFSSGVTILEPVEFGLPVGLLISPGLIKLIRGMVYVPVVNVQTTDALLFPCRVIGMLTNVHVSLPQALLRLGFGQGLLVQSLPIWVH